MNCIIRRLDAGDTGLYREIRLEALKNSPESFGDSFEDQMDAPDKVFQERLKKNIVFGAFVGDELVGTAGLFLEGSRKAKHRARMWGIYVKKEFRGKGIADDLIASVVNYARSCSEQLHLEVTTINSSALKLYERHGFVAYGKDPRALKIGTEYYDEYLMALIF